MLKKILVATDGSARAEKAAEFAISMAKGCGASINVINVVDSGSPRSAMDIDPYDIVDEDTTVLDQLDAEKKQTDEVFVKRVAEMAEKEGLTAETEIRIGNPAEEIISYAAESSADIITLGSHGRSAIGTVIMGSVATDVMRHGKIPVLVVPGRED